MYSRESYSADDLKRKKRKIDGEICLKIIYWGMGGSGKTTILDTLYRLTKEQKKDITPTRNLIKMSMASGSTSYFDRGIFQSTKEQMIYFHVYTVPGPRSLYPLKVKIFNKAGETDGVIFVVDSQTKFLEDNIESLLELKSLAGDRLINEIPLIILLNKQDLKDVIDEDDIIHILKRENLWYEPNEKLSLWNPPIYKTCALFENQKDVYRSFQDCTRMCLDMRRTKNRYLYPYIFRPAHPPDDLRPAVQTQGKIPQEKEESPIKTTEIENLESDKVKKLIKQYEEETDKYAIWHGTITKGFKNWLKGEKVHDHVSSFKDIPIVKDSIKPKDSHYDILLIEEDLATIRLLTSYFDSKDITCKGVVSGTKALEELKSHPPKVVLLDIILTDIDGFEICKKIKSNQKLKNIPVFFIPSIPRSEVEKHLAETKADGYILKPFNFSDFDKILNLLNLNSVEEVEIQQQYEVKISNIKSKKPISKVLIPKPKLKITSKWKSGLVRRKKKTFQKKEKKSEIASYDYTFKIMMLGDADTPKKSLTIRYLSGFFLEEPKLTIGVDFYSKTIVFRDKKIKLQFWTFGGEERFRFLLHQYCKGANAAFFLYNITNRVSLDHLPDWTQIIREHAGDIPIILVGAKAHLEELRAVSKEEGFLAAKKYNLSGFIEVSSKTGQNVEKAFEIIIAKLIEKYSTEII